MTAASLRELVPQASSSLLGLLDPRQAPLQAPIRSEIFGAQRFATHGRSLGQTHVAQTGSAASFMPRLQDNIRRLRQAQRYLARQAAAGIDVSPAGEWLLDNFYLIESQLKAIQEGLPCGFYRGLPRLRDEPLAGLPRVYGVAWAYVAHTDGAFDEHLLVDFLLAYQESRELHLGELWALPTTLRVLLVENLRRLAERLAMQQAARELADLCTAGGSHPDAAVIDQIAALLDRRGAGWDFLAQWRQRTQPQAGPEPLPDALQNRLADVAAYRERQGAEQTADNFSVRNAVNSLRAVGDADWPDIVGRSSALMRLMLGQPGFAADATITRDQALHGIERLARRSGHGELAVAQSLIALMASPPLAAETGEAADPARTTCIYWLQGAGRPALQSALGLPAPWLTPALQCRLAVPAYLGVIALGTAALVGWLWRLAEPGQAAWPWGIGVLGWLLLAFPASEAVVTLMHRLISESKRPVSLPRLALRDGIPPEHRVLVVIPALLSDEATTRQLAHRLRLHALANPERHAQFALLTDGVDAAEQHTAGDARQLDFAQAEVRALNAMHPPAEGAAPRFLLLHRQRQWSASEQRWIGWERKRGKLEQLIEALATGRRDAFVDLGDESNTAADTRYIVTLDSDTQLPPGRLRELVGVAAHPFNLPQLQASGRGIARGYAILQPRVVAPLPSPAARTPYHALFAGPGGIDPYSAASSEVYQDVFGEGSFSGKGLMHVQALQAVLTGRLPEGSVLSHDLLEGALSRCALVSDIALIEDAPAHADIANARLHRWLRGDWQLLPFLLQPSRYGMRGINRWKLIDNLRRALVAPASLALLGLSLAGWGIEPAAAFGLVAAAFGGGALLGAVAGLLPGRSDLAMRHFYRGALSELARALAATVWHLALLLHQALLSADAALRALYRLFVSRRHLLQWTTAAAMQAAHRGGLAAVARRHWPTPLAAALLWGALRLVQTPWPAGTAALCALWAVAPLWIWWSGRVRLPSHIDAADAEYLQGVARDTWRLFERCVGPQDRHLPPDNLQTLPHDMLARRTSPTNIGLYLLSTACARQFGWIGTQTLLDRAEATLATLDGLQRHRGHFLNWYDTATGEPLLPLYVSSVDSGNLSGHLLAVAQACLELAAAPVDTAAQRALHASAKRLQPHRRRWAAAEEPGVIAPGLQAMRHLLAMRHPLAEAALDAPAFEQLLADAAAWLPAPDAVPATAEPRAAEAPTPQETTAWLLADHLATLQSAWLDVRPGAPDAAATARRLRALAARCTRLAWEADFGFLYDHRRHLFHIGYRVAEQQLDASHYDLLASESRLTSLLAIAKGDVPVRHWSALGRPFITSGPDAGLQSWSGSMFEYLMPGLVLAEPEGSVLDEACRTAVQEQRLWGAQHHLPWGVSESAHASRDHTLAYQYGPQGVARLALRRTPSEELLVAPYATALAATRVPHLACRNFARMESMGARGRYGFIEALDFSPARLTGTEPCTLVGTFMAHHQGMTIVALATVLLGAPARRWGMAVPDLEAMAPLLHERAPQAVVRQAIANEATAAPPSRRSAATRRDVPPGQAAVEPTHLLSNGRYQVSLRANGAGASRWGAWGLTRWRDDALRDACGSFFYLRRAGGAPPVSLTQHPAPDEAAQYDAVFHADRVSLSAEWPDLRTQITVWVSPEDDVEFRQVRLHNLGDRALTLQLISAFEPTLNEDRADEAHPAFANLFVRMEWLPAQQGLLIERRPRLESERRLQAAHFLATADADVLAVKLQSDRQRWLGRHRGAHAPLAALETPSAVGEQPVLLDTGLDPLCALGVTLRITPQGTAELTFATAASDDGATLRAMVDKYRQASSVRRASLMSATIDGIRLRGLRMAPETVAALQTLSTALLMNLPRAADPAWATAPVLHDRRRLWRFGISGDRAILLVSAAATHDLALLRPLVQALRLWAWGGVGCDLVVLNAEPASYQPPLQQALGALRDGSGDGLSGGTNTLHLLQANELGTDERSALVAMARVHLHADGRSLAQQVDAWVARHEAARTLRQAVSTAALAPCMQQGAGTAAGRFEAGGAFTFDVGPGLRTQRPWINVLSNPGFGAQLSEAGGGYTWAGNSRLHQLTPWSNDPVTDPAGEWFLLQDLKTLAIWSATPAAWGEAGLDYRVTHSQGETRIAHRRGDLETTVSWCVDSEAAVKQVRFTLVNHGDRPLQLRLIGVAEWQMGAGRADRSTVYSTRHAARLDTRKLIALLATQADAHAGFGGHTAFLAMAAPAAADGDDEDWTCDRRECFDARGQPVVPDQFGQVQGSGLDPCAALSTRLSLAPGQSAERCFLIGHAASVEEAQQLAVKAAAVAPEARLAQALSTWDALLGAVTVATPDPLFDAMVNRWLLYQTVSCRLWAKAGFYQAGGATGFRDQLQDAMALAWAAPQMLRAQILQCAARQYTQGDVQHWWHAPLGAGVRTHCSDDLLWLAHACLHYVRATGDATLLDEAVPFLAGAAIPPGAEDVYDTPQPTGEPASVYEHAARAIDHALPVGAHGLPLMGSGDWNDGMNRVGHEGRGESVWLGWFLCRLVADFAPLARSRGDTLRAQRWEEAAVGWRAALGGHAWDGQWFRRAFFDDGQAFGTHADDEARIDLIAQAWSVLSEVAPPERQRQAMAAVDHHLADAGAGLLRLLDPPLQAHVPNAGYIQAYPPGVRENGGQYSHAGVWALMAQAQLARDGGGREAADAAWRSFTWLSPAHRSADVQRGRAYGLEPYAMAGDVYTQPPWTGRGGWSWYTGAAGWMHRAAIESLFGLEQHADTLRLRPCLPSHWPRAELALRRDGRSLRFLLLRTSVDEARRTAAAQHAQLLLPGQPLHWAGLPDGSCFVLPIGPAQPPQGRLGSETHRLQPAVGPLS